jgi:hypothetical protein
LQLYRKRNPGDWRLPDGASDYAKNLQYTRYESVGTGGIIAIQTANISAHGYKITDAGKHITALSSEERSHCDILISAWKYLGVDCL